MKKLLLISLSLLWMLGLSAQTQTLRGRITDKESKQPLSGVKICITTSGVDSGKFATTDANGEYQLNDISVGRHNLLITLDKYQDLVLQNIILTSAKEVVLNQDMSEAIASFVGGGIKSSRKSQPNNQNALVSARLFTVDETDRFAGSRGDPACGQG